MTADKILVSLSIHGGYHFTSSNFSKTDLGKTILKKNCRLSKSLRSLVVKHIFVKSGKHTHIAASNTLSRILPDIDLARL